MAVQSTKLVLVGTGGPCVSPAGTINLATFRHGVGLILTFQPGAFGTVNAQVSGDDPQQAGGISNWNLHDVLQALTTSANSNLAYPVTAMRLQSGGFTGTAVLSIVQVRG